MLQYDEMTFSYDKILVHFRGNWLHYDEKEFFRAEMLALFPDYRALCRIVKLTALDLNFVRYFQNRREKVYTSMPARVRLQELPCSSALLLITGV